MHHIMASIFIPTYFLCLVNEASESNVGAVEGEASEVELAEDTPTTEGKHLCILLLLFCTFIE